MIGRRVFSFDAIERAGDYFGPVDEGNADGSITSRGVWFLLPIHEGSNPYGRPTRGSGLHRVSEPPWVFRECDDGSLEIRESIACGRGEPDGEYWHGYLDEGHIWRTC
jgi:hypothetical protein